MGAQEVALGVRFSAACKLDITEHPAGLPASQCSPSCGANDATFPTPRTSIQGRPSRDITFTSLEGDFQCFKGVWRIQSGLAGPGTTHLCYSLYVLPQQWLPVGLIQSRIEREVAANLDAVRRHAQTMHSKAAAAAANGNGAVAAQH